MRLRYVLLGLVPVLPAEGPVLKANPFEIFGLSPAMQLCPVELESRYLQLSKQHHPDRAGNGAGSDQLAVLTKAAAVNDAYKMLRNIWSRAKTLIDLHDSNLMEARKSLDPVFLMEAMEEAEAVAHADPTAAGKLRLELEAKVNHCLETLQHALDAGDFERAATLLHQSKYHRKALADLQLLESGVEKERDQVDTN